MADFSPPNILFIQDIGNGNVYADDIILAKVVTNGSNKPIWRLTANGRTFTKCSNVRVHFQCLACSKEVSNKVNLFYRRLIKQHPRCHYCCNHQSALMKQINDGTYTKKDKPTNELKTLNVEQLLEISKVEFDKEDDEYKQAYFRKYLTVEEYDRIKSKIISVNSGEITDLKNLTYVPIMKVANQFRFYPILHNTSQNTLHKIHQLKMKCDCCNDEFVTKSLEVHKNRFKILCRECNCTNSIFKLRPYRTKLGDHIRYQSKLELRFIKHVEDAGVRILNGPKISFTWSGNLHTYAVDFHLPEYHMLIEMKDNHIWHKRQLENGKWNAKECAARDYANNNGENFHVLFPNTYLQFLKKEIKI